MMPPNDSSEIRHQDLLIFDIASNYNLTIMTDPAKLDKIRVHSTGRYEQTRVDDSMLQIW